MHQIFIFRPGERSSDCVRDISESSESLKPKEATFHTHNVYWMKTGKKSMDDQWAFFFHAIREPIARGIDWPCPHVENHKALKTSSAHLMSTTIVPHTHVETSLRSHAHCKRWVLAVPFFGLCLNATTCILKGYLNKKIFLKTFTWIVHFKCNVMRSIVFLVQSDEKKACWCFTFDHTTGQTYIVWTRLIGNNGKSAVWV